jgi:hypothetical protein
MKRFKLVLDLTNPRNLIEEEPLLHLMQVFYRRGAPINLLPFILLQSIAKVNINDTSFINTGICSGCD